MFSRAFVEHPAISPTCRIQWWARRSCMYVRSSRGMSNTSLLTPWNFPLGLYWSNEMSNCIFGFLSNITVSNHDDCPCNLIAASVTVSAP